MLPASLLAIIEVDHDDRVYCQAPDCKKSVYKKIHIVEDAGQILLLGQKCYQLLYKGLVGERSYYTGSESRPLSEVERELLRGNTHRLIEHFEQELGVRRKEEFCATAQPAETAPTISPQQRELTGVERTVRCNHCGKSMITRLEYRPAKGFKCRNCKAA